MTAAELLSQYGITVPQASNWIQANVGNPGLVYNTALQYGVTSNMLAEIVSPWVPGASASLVEGFFDSKGFNGSALGGGSGSTGNEILPSDLAGLASLLTLNNNQGALSTESLRAQVLSALEVDAWYDELFSPSVYQGAADGSFTGEDLGNPSLGTLSATQETLESLYYGTLIKMFKAIDMDEILQINNFVATNGTDVLSGSDALMSQYIDLLVSVFEDPAAVPIFPDATLATTIVNSTAVAAELVGGGEPGALFNGLLQGFLPV